MCHLPGKHRSEISKRGSVVLWQKGMINYPSARAPVSARTGGGWVVNRTAALAASVTCGVSRLGADQHGGLVAMERARAASTGLAHNCDITICGYPTTRHAPYLSRSRPHLCASARAGGAARTAV